MSEKVYEHIVLETEGGKVWFRRVAGQSEQAEIITADAGVIECLTALAKENPDIITVLTEEGEEQIHCIAGKGLAIQIVPCSGAVEFWIERPVSIED